MRGYYLMHRGWLDHPAFGSRAREPLCRAAAWCWLIEEAAYEPIQVRVAGKSIDLKRGQLSISLRNMAEAWGWGHERCRRFLRELAERDMIETAAVPGRETGRETAATVITICNYDKFQDRRKLSRQQARQETRQQPSEKRDSAIYKEERNKEVKNPPPPPNGGVPGFDEFWKAYPRKVGRGAAERKYTAALQFTDEATLLAAARIYADLVIGKDSQYVAHPATWLHQKRWLDDELQQRQVAPASAGPSGPPPPLPSLH